MIHLLFWNVLTHHRQHNKKVPQDLRVGPWSPSAPVTLLFLTISLIYSRPTKILNESLDEAESIYCKVSSYPEAFSTPWYISLFTFLFMAGLFTYICVYRTPGVVVTYTIQSWMMNFTRHGVNMAAPFLVDGHFLLRLNGILRLPALITASVTYIVWNFFLVPFLCLQLKTKQKKKNFLVWNFSSRLVQLHGCNIIYAITNTAIIGSNISVPPFEFNDLWYALLTGTGYAVFYILILDRIGMHLYPLFSPRWRFSGMAWLMLILCYVSLFWVWNRIIEQNLLPSLGVLCTINVFLIVAGCVIVKVIEQLW